MHGRHKTAPSVSERFRVHRGMCGKYAGNVACGMWLVACGRNNYGREAYIVGRNAFIKHTDLTESGTD